jgi:hypothetical protein
MNVVSLAGVSQLQNMSAIPSGDALLLSTALTSWKEIATYLGKSVRTVQRWEASLGLPVRRPNANDRNIVIAIPAELDEWILNRLKPRKATPQHHHCADQLERMHKLVHVMVQETQRTVERTAELLKKFDRTGRRISAIDMRPQEDSNVSQRNRTIQNVN